MRLLICDADPDDVKSALAHLKVSGGISVQINPTWLAPDPAEPLWVACGGPAVKQVQAAGWMPKKGGVEANRGKVFKVQPEGWISPLLLGVTYAPHVRHIDYAQFVHFETDIALYRRLETTGSMAPQLGTYGYANDLSGVIRYLKARHAQTGAPVELALDTETEGLDPFNPEKRIVCIQATAKAGISDVVYTYSMSWAYLQSTIIPQLKWIAEQPWIRVVGANFKYDMLWMRVKWGVVFKNFAFDTCNGGSLVEENRSNTLNLHTKVYTPELGGYDDDFNRRFDKSKMGEVPRDDLLPYAGGDSDACLRNYYHIRKEVVSDNLTKSGKPAKNSLASVYLNIVHPALMAVHRMEHVGFVVDKDKFHALGADLYARRTESAQKAAKLLPKVLLDAYGGLDDEGAAPLSKPKMIADFLFTPMGLNLQPVQVTEKTGAPSTSEFHLTQFKDHPEAAPLIEAFIDYKNVAKMYGTYYEGFLKHLRSDGRWHASYIIHRQGKDQNNEQDAGGTVTGRGSATDPAFQCVAGDAEIMTPHGLRTAASLIDPLFEGDTYNPFKAHERPVWGTGGWQVTSNVFRSWRHDLLRVRLKGGNELTCTPEHPFWMGAVAGWVPAKDLVPGESVPLIDPVQRAPGPEWVTPEIAEALGVVAAAGYLTATGDMLYLQVPAECGAVVAKALEQVGLSPALSAPESGEATSVVVEARLTADAGWKAATLALWLPHPSAPVLPWELRGTVRMYDVFRGVVSAGAEAAKVGAAKRLRVRVASRALALAMARETALDGLVPPMVKAGADSYTVTWYNYSAGNMLKAAGMPTQGFNTGENKRAAYYAAQEVESVTPAGAGYVYDFTVPTTHDFIANSMLVHNTVPKHSYWGKRLRECMTAPPGHVIVARDYSQGELKVTACWASEGKMIEAYRNGVDLHTLTAATVNGMTYEEALFLKEHDEAAYKSLRQNGKAGNFGLIYGMQAYGFMVYAERTYGVKLTLEQAEAMRDAFFNLYPGLPEWHDRQIMEAQMTGAVRSPLGRLRHLPNINSPMKKEAQKAKNQAINSPIQATLVDMMWWSMGIIERERPNLLAACGQIHDQGIWYSPEDQADEAVAYSGEVMENLPFLEKFGWNPELDFTSDAEVGYNLAELKEAG